jgi:hypothetical protein
MRSRGLPVGVAVLWLVSGNGTATLEAQPFSAPRGSLFGSHRDGDWEVYVTEDRHRGTRSCDWFGELL